VSNGISCPIDESPADLASEAFLAFSGAVLSFFLLLVFRPPGEKPVTDID
jgi:hypothetical protein